MFSNSVIWLWVLVCLKYHDHDQTNSFFNLEELHLLFILSYSDCFGIEGRWVFLNTKNKGKFFVLNAQKDSLTTYLYLILPAWDSSSSCPHIKYNYCQRHNMKPRAMQSFLSWPLQNWFIVSHKSLKLVYWERKKYLGSEYAFFPEENILYKLREKCFQRGRLSFLLLSYSYSQSLSLSLFHVFPRGILFEKAVKGTPVNGNLTTGKKKKKILENLCFRSEPKFLLL